MNDWWVLQLEGLRQREKCTDVALAKRLDISPAMLAHVRMGRRDLPIHGRLRLLHALDYVITPDLFLRSLPEEIRSALVDTNALIEKPGEPDPNAGREMPPFWR